MNKLPIAAGLMLPLALPLHAADAANGPYRFADDWPTHYVFADGTDLGLSLKYQYDVDRFPGDGDRFEDAQTNRRKEFGFYLKKKDVYDLVAGYDFQARAWVDTYLQLHGRGLLGRDVGTLRLGFSKTPVGLEGNTSTGATTFLEAALPTQAVYANRRIGVDWTLARPHYLTQVGYYRGGDLNGDNDGRMVALRAAWVPIDTEDRVLHLGLAASREWPEGSTDGRGVHTPPGVRLRARPEAAFAPRLVDSGTLAFADSIDRRGVEALWIDGPWSVQGEWLAATVERSGEPDYRIHGYYAFASWMLTGESRPYAAGNVKDPKPSHPFGAVELALRYSQLDLDDAPVLGGREHDWTAGINWYVNRYLKLQANYVRARSSRPGEQVRANVLELRAQVQF
ncbi:OprO/OprP family phosphate-selective porin [Fulvimonas yonginensis]|uniref:Porin n=1 Tax=Fulvimonas yonginensis TaxID=1495200 RepID=A0ABU8JAM3_9GAMM